MREEERDHEGRRERSHNFSRLDASSFFTGPRQRALGIQDSRPSRGREVVEAGRSKPRLAPSEGALALARQDSTTLLLIPQIYRGPPAHMAL